jgi:hypothetical protein
MNFPPPSTTFDRFDNSYHHSFPSSTPYTSHSYHMGPPSSSSSTLPPFSRPAAPSTPFTTPGGASLGFKSTLGTAENPLIPKRRRRTTPAELAILETEFRANPRPDPQERARIAERLGMTVRAVQVWLQNRRYVALFLCFSRSSPSTFASRDPRRFSWHA